MHMVASVSPSVCPFVCAPTAEPFDLRPSLPPKQRSCLIQADSTFSQIQTRFNICSSFVMGTTAAFMEKMIVELSHKYS